MSKRQRPQPTATPAERIGSSLICIALVAFVFLVLGYVFSATALPSGELNQWWEASCCLADEVRVRSFENNLRYVQQGARDEGEACQIVPPPPESVQVDYVIEPDFDRVRFGARYLPTFLLTSTAFAEFNLTIRDARGVVLINVSMRVGPNNATYPWTRFERLPGGSSKQAYSVGVEAVDAIYAVTRYSDFGCCSCRELCAEQLAGCAYDRYECGQASYIKLSKPFDRYELDGAAFHSPTSASDYPLTVTIASLRLHIRRYVSPVYDPRGDTGDGLPLRETDVGRRLPMYFTLTTTDGDGLAEASDNLLTAASYMILVVSLVMCFPVVCVWWAGGCGAADGGQAEIRRTSVCPNGMGAAVAAVCIDLRNLAVWLLRRACSKNEDSDLVAVEITAKTV